MGGTKLSIARAVLSAAVCAAALGEAAIAQPITGGMHERRAVIYRDPAGLPRARMPNIGPPLTVADRSKEIPTQSLALDDAIRIALENSEVVRVLGGLQAVSSGSTIYDAPIIDTQIDEQKARFDPTVTARNTFNRFETPVGVFDPGDPSRALIVGTRTDNYDLDFDLTKTIRSGGVFQMGVNTTPSRFQPGIFPLNPENRSSVDLLFTQPLLQGAGAGPNLAPVVIAAIDTERSFFRFKNSVQQMVAGVIDAYWSLVFARVDRWARQQQVEQAEKAYDQSETKQRFELANLGNVAETRLALANFRAALVTAEANVLAREAALRNIMGIPPESAFELVPTTPPSKIELPVDWEQIVRIAEQRRPDLIELKLIIEADQQLLMQANNLARPQLDAVALYRWNGLEGQMPIGDSISTRPGQFTDWALGVNFSVPFGLRASRAGLRRQQLLIARDRANLQQGLHNAVHLLAGSVRNQASLYAQYVAFREAREAAEENLKLQFGQYRADRVIFLNVLQAITSWGNAVSAEAQTLLQYNSELAILELETGTILETHGVAFVEERYGAIGPLGRLAAPVCYPRAIAPTENAPRYPAGDEPSEDVFELDNPYSPRAPEEPVPVPPPSGLRILPPGDDGP